MTKAQPEGFIEEGCAGPEGQAFCFANGSAKISSISNTATSSKGNTEIFVVSARPLPLGVECLMIFEQQIKQRTAVAQCQEIPEVQTVLCNYTVLLF